MLVLYRDDKVIGTASDDYAGPETAIVAPSHFDIAFLSEFKVRLGKLVFPFRGVWHDASEALIFEKLKRMAQVKLYCTTAMQAGYIYVFPDGKTGTIQTRNERDACNLQRIVTTALIQKSKGSKAVFTDFRDMENDMHPLTPDQAIALHEAVDAYLNRQLKRKWEFEEQIMAAADEMALAMIFTNMGWGT